MGRLGGFLPMGFLGSLELMVVLLLLLLAAGAGVLIVVLLNARKRDD